MTIPKWADRLADLMDEFDEKAGVSFFGEWPDFLFCKLTDAETELEQWKTRGIVEIAVRNPSVAEYMEHWEGRATKAEAEQNQFLSLVCKYQCNPTWQLSNFEAIRNHLETVHRLCNENYDWAKRLEAELARLQWQPITPENLPKLGDEIMMSKMPEMIYAVDRFASKYTYDVWKRYGWTHFRPINLPKETA